jgi:N-acetylglucosaminyldiphosphoundecaprenol N-acetyl-beta-D-mannosaminyltransferase
MGTLMTLARRRPIGGVRFSDLDRAGALSLLAAPQDGRGPLHVHFANAYTVTLADADPVLRELLNSHDSVVFADGRPISVLSHLTGAPGLTHLPGPDAFEAAFDLGRRELTRHFLLGSTESTLERLRSALTLQYPGTQIVGTHSPPFGTVTTDAREAQDDAIAAARPDIVWVGLGTPKQDHEAARIARGLGIRAVAVGAAFDFSAGNVRRAPRWIRRIGLEWLVRLLQEPRRLWRRYVVGNLRFLIIAVREVGRR